MSEKHTRGQWYIENDEFIATDEKFICSLYFGTRLIGQPEYTESQANANLIAAAPDLLAALEAFVQAWEKSLQLEKTDVALRLAKAAIAKAKGETK